MTKKKIYALGFFDGVHLGHQALLAKCRQMAQQLDAEPAVITFDQHPKALFLPQIPVLINSIEDRKTLLRRYGMNEILVLPVTRQTMQTPWQAFLEALLEQGAAGFVCGDDFRFGHQGQGDAEKLCDFCRERDLPCAVVPEQMLDGIRVSSTYIRQMIESGQMETAEKFLGHPHILSGNVTHGRHLGRTIGVPTANLLLPEGVVVPKLGVYACVCGGYVAVTNIGSRPTVEGHQVRAESWILDFDGDLYGETITLEFHKFLRQEQKFDSLEELKRQIRNDAAKAKQFLR